MRGGTTAVAILRGGIVCGHEWQRPCSAVIARCQQEAPAAKMSLLTACLFTTVHITVHCLSSADTWYILQ